MSLWLELSEGARNSGDFALALQAGRKAWEQARRVTEGNEELAQAEEALANLASLHALLGQHRALGDLLAETARRAPHIASSSRVEEARLILANWDADPDTAALCGIAAYNVLAEKSGAPRLHKPSQDWVPQTPEDRQKELQGFIADGLSAAQLLAKVQASGSDWRWIKRTAGAIIPSPAVIHLRFGGETGHYSALVEGDANTTLLVDRYLRLEGRMENETINRQTSGYFMVPARDPLPAGFAVPSAEELATVFGRAGCPVGYDLEGHHKPKCGCHGMAVATASRFLPGLVIQDQPLT